MRTHWSENKFDALLFFVVRFASFIIKRDEGSSNASHNTPPRATFTTPPNTRVTNKANFLPSFEQSKDNSSLLGSNETPTTNPQYTKTSTRLNKRSVSDKSDFEILKVLTSYRRHLKFSQVCNKNKPDIFGYTGTEKQRQVGNHRECIKKLDSSKPVKFLALCNTRAILLGASAATATERDTFPVRPTTPPSSNQEPPPSVYINATTSSIQEQRQARQQDHGNLSNHPLAAKGYGKLVVM